MTFNDAEISTQDGQPVALYTLKWGNTIWRYTSADRDIIRSEAGADVTYAAAAVSDEGMVQGGGSANDFTMNLSTDLPIVETFRAMPPSESIWLTVRRIHADEDEAPIYWIGLVANVQKKDEANAVVRGIPITATFKRAGLRLGWSRGCNHCVYDTGCRLNPVEWGTATGVTAVAGNRVSLTYAAGMIDPAAYRGGFLSWEVNADKTLERRVIEEIISDTTKTQNNVTTRTLVIQVFGAAYPLAAGKAITIYPGCDLTPETCDGRFDNLANHGGFKFMTGKSPFNGEPVF